MRSIPRYTLVWDARYTLGARYLSKNTVNKNKCIERNLCITLVIYQESIHIIGCAHECVVVELKR